MTKYIPFLKAKQNEIKSISELSSVVRHAICPFFDFPKKMGGYGKTEFKEAAQRIMQRLKKNIPEDFTFYFDNFDVEDGLDVDGKHNYVYLLKLLANMRVIPVVGLDRSSAHNNAVSDFKTSAVLTSDFVAFRVGQDDFEEFDVVQDDIESELGPVFGQFEKVDLVLDCRICTSLD